MLDTGEARDQLEDILGKIEYRVYHRNEENILVVWWNNVKEWLAEQLMKLFPSAKTTDTVAEMILIVVLILTVVFVIVGANMLIRHTKRKRKFRNQAPLQTWEEKDWTFERHLREALKNEELKEYSLASRHLFLALLLYFHKKGWLEKRIWKTNWEYYAELKRENDVRADEFYQLARFFDEVTYGEKELKYDEYKLYRKLSMKWLDGVS